MDVNKTTSIETKPRESIETMYKPPRFDYELKTLIQTMKILAI